MNWEQIGEMLNEPLTQLTVLGVVLVYYVICYTTRIASGRRRVSKQGKKWSWKQFWSDILDRLQAIFVLVGLIIGSDITQWLAPLIGVNLNETVSASLNATLIVAIPFIAGLAELFAAAKNTQHLWGWKKNIASLGMTNGDINPSSANLEEIANTTWKFLDTVTEKTIHEMWEEEGVTGEVLEGEVLEGGKGSIENTYPEPYRSAVQDTIFDPAGCYNRECVSYCAWKVYELTGKWLAKYGSMNAKYWVQRLAENGYTTVLSAPREGGFYVGVTEAGTYGHVVWYETGKIITEYNYASRGCFSVREINLSAYKWVEIKAPNTALEIGKEVADKPKEDEPKKTSFKVGDKVVPLTKVDYDGRKLKQYDDSYTITQISGNRAVLSARGQVWAAMNTDNIKKA